jgi:hypothetical protein
MNDASAGHKPGLVLARFLTPLLTPPLHPPITTLHLEEA